MRRGLIEGGYESTAVKSGAINQLEGLLSKLLFVLQTRGLGYRCILSRQSSELSEDQAVLCSFLYCTVCYAFGTHCIWLCPPVHYGWYCYVISCSVPWFAW